MRDPPHLSPTGSADSYAGRSSVPSNQPCSQLCAIILTPFQSDVRTLMQAHPHSTPTSRAGRYAGSHSLDSSRPSEQLCLHILAHFQPGCSPLCRIILTPHQPAVLAVMPDPPQSLPTSPADRSVGPFSFHSNRPCGQLCRPHLAPFQPVVLIVMRGHSHFTPTGRAHS